MPDSIAGCELASVVWYLGERWTAVENTSLLVTGGGITENTLCKRGIIGQPEVRARVLYILPQNKGHSRVKGMKATVCLRNIRDSEATAISSE